MFDASFSFVTLREEWAVFAYARNKMPQSTASQLSTNKKQYKHVNYSSCSPQPRPTVCIIEIEHSPLSGTMVPAVSIIVKIGGGRGKVSSLSEIFVK